jgi:serine protease inhibitor
LPASAVPIEKIALGNEKPEQPAVFRADHPFLFLIRENTTGSLIFVGRVADPRG